MEHYNKEQSGIRIQVPVCDKQTVVELSSDLSLPDYQPQIKRLLRVRANVSHPDQYVGAGTADFSGTVDYAILYSANDGALYCANESADYRFSIPVELTSDIDLNEGLVCDVNVIPDTATGRVVAPRRLSVKCRLRAHVKLWGIRHIEESIIGAEGTEQLQRLCGQTESARMFVGIGEPLQLGDEILFDAAETDLRVISAEGEVFLNEAEAGSGSVNCRGEVALKLLCCHESSSEPPVTLLRRIPFAQAVLTDGAEVNCICTADGYCSDIRITVEEGRLLCDVTVSLRTRAQRNETLSFTRDLYSTSATCDSRTETCLLPLALRCVNGNFSLNTTLPLEEVGIRSGMSIADISLTPTVTALEQDHGKYYLTGRCRAQVILTDAEDAVAQEFDLPFRYETDGGTEEVTDYDVTVRVISCRARLDGERIGVDAELAIGLCTRGETRVEVLTEARMGDTLVRSGAVCTVCYPSREDTLWSVAKRYCRAVDEIATANDLSGAPAADSPESLAGIKYLLV